MWTSGRRSGAMNGGTRASTEVVGRGQEADRMVSRQGRLWLLRRSRRGRRIITRRDRAVSDVLSVLAVSIVADKMTS